MINFFLLALWRQVMNDCGQRLKSIIEMELLSEASLLESALSAGIYDNERWLSQWNEIKFLGLPAAVVSIFSSLKQTTKYVVNVQQRSSFRDASTNSISGESHYLSRWSAEKHFYKKLWNCKRIIEVKTAELVSSVLFLSQVEASWVS